ncbi:hypothetical protein BdWA1_001325 [Babesia duncani]|uniref:Uncharacterized protein n=1 Tax=Babesia duncani TaxID=323732 RepID=A0AAD9PNV8_9APIC|nr:hypothetical protein BdWA1_001325 [Babesia duncani]
MYGNCQGNCTCTLCRLKTLKEGNLGPETTIKVLADVIKSLKLKRKLANGRDTIIDAEFWFALEYIFGINEHLVKLDRLDIGSLHHKKRLEASKDSSADECKYLKDFLRFDAISKHAHDTVLSTIHNLTRMENKLNAVRINSLKLLKQKHLDTLVKPCEGTGNDLDGVDYKQMLSNLNAIWHEKLTNLSKRLKIEFKRLVLNHCEEIKKSIPTRLPLQVSMMETTPPDPYATTTFEIQNDYYTQGMEAIKEFFKQQNITEETGPEYIARVSELNKRLLPRVVKAAQHLPIFTEAHVNALFDFDPNTPNKATSDDCGIGNGAQDKMSDFKFIKRTSLEFINCLRAVVGTQKKHYKNILLCMGNALDVFTLKSDVKNHLERGLSRMQIRNAAHSKALGDVYQSKMLWLQTDDLAGEEIDKMINEWFPRVTWTPFEADDDADVPVMQNKSSLLDLSDAKSTIWKHRLSQLNQRNGKHIENCSLAPFEYCSSLDSMPTTFTLKSLDFENYIPIKYTIKQNMDSQYSWLTSLAMVDDSPCQKRAFKSFNFLTKTWCFEGKEMNALILPLHANVPLSRQHELEQLKLKFQYKTDYLFPTLDEQLAEWEMKSTDKLPQSGDIYITYHSHLIGSIAIIFHLVTCDGTLANVPECEDPEAIQMHAKTLSREFEALDKIFTICNYYSVGMLYIPASLRCCFDINGQIVHGKDLTLACNQTTEMSMEYLTCLAVTIHLANCLNYNYPKSVCLIYPPHLRHTQLSLTATSTLTSRLVTI